MQSFEEKMKGKRDSSGNQDSSGRVGETMGPDGETVVDEMNLREMMKVST
jgi:hypothetical protein